MTTMAAIDVLVAERPRRERPTVVARIQTSHQILLIDLTPEQAFAAGLALLDEANACAVELQLRGLAP